LAARLRRSVAEIVKREDVEVWVDGERQPAQNVDPLAEKANALHRSAQAKASEAVAEFIQCGEVLLEAKDKAGRGKWLEWLDRHFEGSRRHAQRYMELANNKHLLDATRVSHDSLRGAMRQIRDHKDLIEREEREERKEEFRRRWREQEERILSGEVWLPMKMEASHAYDFEDPPEGFPAGGPPLLCLVEERIGAGSFGIRPDWNDKRRLWPLEKAFQLGPSKKDKELLCKLLGVESLSRRKDEFRWPPAVDLKASTSLYDDEGSFRPPIRKLSWAGTTVLLPTGRVGASLLGDTIWSWWEWDVLDGFEIVSEADPALVNRADLLSAVQYSARSDIIGRVKPGWEDAREVEAALGADLSYVRGRLAKSPPDLSDPRVVYEIGQRVLDEVQLRRAEWHRLRAYAKSLE
jgi:Protein of unknown function (DUF3102)